LDCLGRVLAEFWQGAIRAGHATKVVNQFLALGMPLLNAEPVVLVYAELCSRLQVKSYYKGIGQNDLWIAAVSLAYNKPLVTRNRRHFARIDGLDLQVLAP
jgi:predicted nucleic acid-binding protein